MRQQIGGGRELWGGITQLATSMESRLAPSSFCSVTWERRMRRVELSPLVSSDSTSNGNFWIPAFPLWWLEGGSDTQCRERERVMQLLPSSFSSFPWYLVHNHCQIVASEGRQVSVFFPLVIGSDGSRGSGCWGRDTPSSPFSSLCPAVPFLSLPTSLRTCWESSLLPSQDATMVVCANGKKK